MAEMRTRIGAYLGKIARRKHGQDKERVVSRMQQSKQLLSGIHDDVTLGVITPKFPWKIFLTLSSVSCFWSQAIQHREPYHARVCSHSTETFVLHKEITSTPYDPVIALYSVREKCCYQLPGIPHIPRGIPRSCKCVLLDGIIYVIGGSTEEMTDDGRRKESAEVYMLDLAGQRQWKSCARMGEPRRKFGCAVLDGKVYVFGGYSHGNPVCTCEMFDPKENSWLSIWLMKAQQAYHQVGTFGDEFFIHGGLIQEGNETLRRDRSMEVYHSVKERWAKVKPLSMPNSIPNDLQHGLVTTFMAEGKFYFVTKSTVHVKGINSDSWEKLQSFSFPVTESFKRWRIVWKCSHVLVVNNEILVGVQLYGPEGRCGEQLFLSQGFGIGKEMSWQILPRCTASAHSMSFLMDTIEL